MPLEIGIWRVDGAEPVKVLPSGLPLEARLETLIEQDPSILGEPLLLIGRQVPTDYGKMIDLLAIDADGALHVLELKRDRTPREVVAQVLDYGSWILGLTHEQVLGHFAAYRRDISFEEAFADRFGISPPEELNSAQRLTVVASDVDGATERIVGYLNGGFQVPINVVFFRYYSDEGREYLARTWLIDEMASLTRSARATSRGTKEEWNGRDWSVSFGEESGSRNWDDARTYGFISAGGGTWFSRTLRSLPAGARVFVCIPKSGYVGVGTVRGEAVRFDDAVVVVDGEERRLRDVSLVGAYRHPLVSGEDTEEYVVPVDWLRTRPRVEALWKRGMFANQNSACKLRNKFTLDELAVGFSLDDDVMSK